MVQGPLVAVFGCAYGTRTERGDQMFAAMVRRSCAAIRDHDTIGLAPPGLSAAARTSSRAVHPAFGRVARNGVDRQTYFSDIGLRGSRPYQEAKFVRDHDHCTSGGHHSDLRRLSRSVHTC